MSCMFPVTNQRLAQLDLLRYWKEPQPTRTMSKYILPKQLDDNQRHITFLQSVRISLSLLMNRQIAKEVKDEGHFKGEHCRY